jgi:hypothetical protein
VNSTLTVRGSSRRLASGSGKQTHQLQRAELLGDTVFAIVVPDTFTFGLARQSATLAAPLDSAAVFYSRGDAEAWLREANAKKAP